MLAVLLSSRGASLAEVEQVLPVIYASWVSAPEDAQRRRYRYLPAIIWGSIPLFYEEDETYVVSSPQGLHPAPEVPGS